MCKFPGALELSLRQAEGVKDSCTFDVSTDGEVLFVGRLSTVSGCCLWQCGFQIRPGSSRSSSRKIFFWNCLLVAMSGRVPVRYRGLGGTPVRRWCVCDVKSGAVL